MLHPRRTGSYDFPARVAARPHCPDGPLESSAILTTEANELARPVHDRMPVLLDRRHFEQWLDPTQQDAEGLAPMLRPFRAEAMRAYPVNP
jgi:putative SOS response-associated peptidase YedK